MEQKAFQVSWVNPATLIKTENNPRKIKDKKFSELMQSIKEFPEMMSLRPIVVDGKSKILGGEKRYLACVELKWPLVPVVIADTLNEKQKAEFIVKDNLSSGEFDMEILTENWGKKDLVHWGFKLVDIKEGAKKYPKKFKVIVDCASKKDQATAYNAMVKAGFKVRKSDT